MRMPFAVLSATIEDIERVRLLREYKFIASILWPTGQMPTGQTRDLSKP